MDGDRTPPERRLTVGEAAEILGITAEAVRSRIKRGTLESVKDRNTVYVLLSPDQTTHEQRPGDAQTADQTRRDTLINMLREQVAYLQSVIATRDEELARRDEEIRRRDAALEREQQLTAMFAERLWVIEAPSEEPSEPRESPVTFRVGRERADPGEEARGQVEPTERPRQRSSWRAPVDKLPLWQYLLGLGLIAGLLLVLTLDFFYKLDPAGIRTYLFWVVPAMFGFWVGLKRRHLSLWRNLFPIGLMAGATAAVATVPIQGTTGYSSLVNSLYQ